MSRRGKETVSTTLDIEDENRATRLIRTSTLTDGSRLLAAFQVNCSRNRPVSISNETEGEADCCVNILEVLAVFKWCDHLADMYLNNVMVYWVRFACEAIPNT